MDEVSGRESSISHTVKDHGDRVLRLRNGTVISREGSVGTTSQEFESGSTRAVGNTDSTGELNQITGGDVVSLQEGTQSIDGGVNTKVSGEVNFGIGEDDHGTVSAGTLELAREGETNGVVEGQTKNFVSCIE